MEITKTQRKQRICTMIFGAFAIFFTGYPHIWSVYQPYVMKLAGWSQAEASFCFYLALATFVFGNIVGGRIFRISTIRKLQFWQEEESLQREFSCRHFSLYHLPFRCILRTESCRDLDRE